MAETTERQRMALSKPESIRRDISNCACIARIISGPCTNILRNVLANKISLPDLKRKFSSLIRYYQIDKDAFFKLERLIAESNENYSDFEIPSMYFFLRWICDIPQHGNRWGQYPREKDRSLSANIERIYLIRAKYRRLRHGSLSDSTIENEWENIFTTVKELEKFIGFGEENQDAMIKIKNASLDPDVEDILIKHLLGYDHDDELFKILEYEMELHLRLKPIEVKALSLGPIREHYKDPSMSMREQRGLDLRSEIQTSLDPSLERLQSSGYGSVEEFHDDISESTGEEKYIPPKYEQITSKTLKELFESYEVDFPTDVPGCESIARKVLGHDIKMFVTAIRSLSQRIVLSSSKKAITPKPQVEVCVFEVEVVYGDGGDGKEETQLCVFRKDTSLSMLCDMEEDTRIRVILIRSESIPVVSSKLFVYKNFKHAINEKKIFLQHEYDDFDDLAKLIAYRLFSLFCSSVESIVNAFTMDLQKIMLDNCDRQMTVEEIEQTCLDVLKKTADKPRFWPIQAVNMIKSKLSKEKLLGEEAWSDIQKACQQTVTDLKVILSRLEEFQTKKLQVDQRKEIGEWLKREVIEDKASLPEYPSIIKCIAGQRDDKNVVKVYHSGDITEEAKDDFKEKCKLEKTDFEFVNIDGTNEMPDEIKKTEALEREPLDVDRSNIKELDHIIEMHTDKLYASYSNIIGIRIGRRVHYDKLEQCIIIYCLDKTLIPFGEKKIPETLAGWPCDLREDFIMLGMCSTDCKSIGADYPKLGCSIGRLATKGFGSVGFMYESRDSDISGFLTASHVAVENCGELHKGNQLMSSHHLGQKEHTIVHPSWGENNCVDHPVGQVVESFFGNYESSEGLDFAAVKTNKRREGERETLEVYNEDNGIFKKKVMKTGSATGLEYGLLLYKMSININHPPKSKYNYIFKNIYIVRSQSEQSPFFWPGDSGSGVFVVEKQEPFKALGIGFGISLSKMTYVCKIGKILNTLGLKIVKYKEQPLPITNET